MISLGLLAHAYALIPKSPSGNLVLLIEENRGIQTEEESRFWRFL